MSKGMNLVSGRESVGGNPLIHIAFEADGEWPDLLERPVHYVNEFTIGTLRQGMGSGRPSAMIRIDLPDGSTVVAETSLRLLISVVEALKARYANDERFVQLNEKAAPGLDSYKRRT